MSPDVHFVRLRDKLVAELRMSHGNNRLGLLPGGEALEAVSYTHLDVYKRQAQAVPFCGRPFPKLPVTNVPTG